MDNWVKERDAKKKNEKENEIKDKDKEVEKSPTKFSYIRDQENGKHKGERWIDEMKDLEKWEKSRGYYEKRSRRRFKELKDYYKNERDAKL